MEVTDPVVALLLDRMNAIASSQEERHVALSKQMDSVTEAIQGNGRPGLKADVQSLKEAAERNQFYFRMLAGVVAAGVLERVFSIWPKIAI